MLPENHAIGQTATWVSLGLPSEEISSLALDLHRDSILYAGSYSDFSAGTQGGIFRSINGGHDWDTLFRGGSVSQVVIHPESSHIVFASLGSSSGSQPGIIKSTDGGESWFRSDSGISLDWETSVVPLVIDPSAPEILFAGTGGFSGGGLYRSTDGGAHWSLMVDSIAGIYGSFRAIGIAPWPGSRVFATNNTGRIFRSDDRGETWAGEHPPGFGGGMGTQFVFAQRDPVVYQTRTAGSASPKGIFASRDGGASWVNIGANLPGVYADGRCVAVRETPTAAELFLAAKTYIDVPVDSGRIAGVFVSHDGGDVWTHCGLDSTTVSALQLSADGTRIYAGVSSAYLGIALGVYMTEVLTGVAEDPVERPPSSVNVASFPNPFNSSTTLSFTLATPASVVVELFDLTGARIRNLTSGEFSAGRHDLAWDGRDERGRIVASGVYIARVRLGGTMRQPATYNVRLMMVK